MPSKPVLLVGAAAVLLLVLGGVLWFADRRAKARIEASNRIAERWTSWWCRAAWRTDPQEPWDEDEG